MKTSGLSFFSLSSFFPVLKFRPTVTTPSTDLHTFLSSQLSTLLFIVLLYFYLSHSKPLPRANPKSTLFFLSSPSHFHPQTHSYTLVKPAVVYFSLDGKQKLALPIISVPLLLFTAKLIDQSINQSIKTITNLSPPS